MYRIKILENVNGNFVKVVVIRFSRLITRIEEKKISTLARICSARLFLIIYFILLVDLSFNLEIFSVVLL